MTHSSDVVVIGGGAIGGAVATAVLEDPAFAGRVTVIERDPTFRRASSALSAASIRQQFSTPENIRMSRYSFGWLRQAGVGLRESGYLFLATAVGAAVLEDNVTVQRGEGAEVELLSVREVGARFPWLALEGVALASLGREGEGWFDGYALVQVLRTRARELGADLVTAEVVDLEIVGDRVATVILADGRRIEPDVVVDAAGPWAREVAAMAGVDLPVEARRRSVFVFDVASDPPIDCPLVIDTSGAWFRPEGESFIAGIAPPQADDLADLPLEVDRDQFERQLWPALAARVPAFDAVKVTNAWAGYYEVNTFDHNAIIGPHPRIANLLFANGFSGHGIQQAPAVGRALAELIVHGGYRTLDLSIFGVDRIAAGRPVLERNVIG
jgi:glycine/D-amino acid oxidase-like deaminating enzyme